MRRLKPIKGHFDSPRSGFEARNGVNRYTSWIALDRPEDLV
jgi:hypothetical protein